MRDVEVHNNQGKVICKIEPRYTWKDLLLSFTPFSRKWKEPLAVEQWAWETAQYVASWEAEGHEPVMKEGRRLYDCSALCQACLNYSVLPVTRRHRMRTLGYSCINEGCSMRGVIIPNVLVENIAEKPIGLAFAPLLIAFKEKPEALTSAAVAWLMSERHQISKPAIPAIYRDDDGRILEWTNPIDKEKIIQQLVSTKHITECIEAGFCTRCEKPIIDFLKKADSDTEAPFAHYMYLLIHSKTGLCISCIDEFLESVFRVWKKQ